MIKAVQQIMLGHVTANEKSALKTLSAIKAAGYDAIELNGFMIRPTPLLIRALTRAAGMPTGRGGALNWEALLAETGLSVSSLHEDLGSIERDTAAVAAQAHRFGTEYVVITGMYRFDYSDPEALKTLVQRLNTAGSALKGQGISLLYHNHNCEFLRLPGGGTAYEYLLQETDPACVNFEFDSYWPTEAGVNALSVMEQLGMRMKLWHINDRGSRVTGPCMTPILKSDSMELGCGNMALLPMVAQARAAGVSAVILESHKNWVDGSPIASLQKSAEFMNRYI